MAYIIKDTAALLNTQITDLGRQRLSQGNFNISYFQLGDSEVCYNCISGANLTTLQVFVPEYNAANNVGAPQSNRLGIKYPIFLSSSTGDTNTFGIPFQDSVDVDIFNTPQPRGFFTGGSGNYSAFTSSALTVTANYEFNLSGISASTILRSVQVHVTHRLQGHLLKDNLLFYILMTHQVVGLLISHIQY